MQDLNWSDLRFALAVHRGGSLAAAARRMGVNETTVARRLHALGEVIGAPLFIRNAAGRLWPTSQGQVVVGHAERMEPEADALTGKLGQLGDRLTGRVRLTAVPILVNHVLVPALGPLLKAHPDLDVELVPEARDLNLTRREADLALRLARPRDGGQEVLTRRVGTLGYVLCAPAQCEAPASLSWLLYDEAHSGLPQARWMARQGGAISGLKVSDAETLQAAISDGLGKGLLPACVAKRDARIRIIPTEGLPSRDIWLLSHKAQRGLPAVEAAVDWLVSLSWH